MNILLAILGLFGGLVIFILIIKKEKGQSKKISIDEEFIERKWREIEQLAASQKPSGYKTAIMEADKLVDYALKGKVKKGNTMGERLKNAQKSFTKNTYEDLWDAHKMRNKIAHESEYDVLHSQIQNSINSFKKALDELK